MDKRFLFVSALVLVLMFFISTSNYITWVAKSFILMFFIPTLFILFVKYNPEKIGFNVNKIKLSLFYTILIIIIALPFLFYFSTDTSFKNYYPIWKGQVNFLPAESLLFFSMLGVEFFFRGFLINTLTRYVNWKYAIVLQAILYMLIHIGKPAPEVLLSLFAGLVFGYAAYKTKSIVAPLTSHYSIAIIFDLLTVHS